jgi:hypothetical protein
MHKIDNMYTDNAENAIYRERLHDYLVFHGINQGDWQSAAVAMGQSPPPISTTMVTEELFRQTQSYECQKQRFCTLDRENEPTKWYASVEYQANDFGNVDANTRRENAAKLTLTMNRRSENERRAFSEANGCDNETANGRKNPRK